ncbi:hypothetical protein [Paenibacillus harenae]|uniref:hypothetical protein n=1 Tax=Paenibacillus harenae TaxID=306543 RepID=UPI00279133B7|nr:hypothetical protein [Paenibacillus harenae]MDQ0061248.1 hypothetical protein [Paenibacillus harenae]
MRNEDRNEEGRKPYYVSVQAGQILADPEAAAYELVINANDAEISRLHELFKELAAADNWGVRELAANPYNAISDEQRNSEYDSLLQRVYKQLYDCGTDTTKRHIESMQLW